MEKSASIRLLLSEQPDLSPKEIQAELGRRGVEVTRNLCKVIRYRVLHGKRSKRSPFGDKTPSDLRRGERRVWDVGIVRLGPKDLEIWNQLKAHAELLADPSRELHELDGWYFNELPEVRIWIDTVSTVKAKKRRQAILEQFYEDLRRLYPPPNKRKSILDKNSGTKIVLPPISFSPHPRGRKRNEVFSVEQDNIWATVKTLVERHGQLWGLFLDSEVIDYLLSSETWVRYQALKAMADSYSIHSALNDLLELAWLTTKPIGLPETLKQLHNYVPVNYSEMDDPWKNHPEVSCLLFLLSLWISRRIEISRSDQDGICQVMIDRLYV